jgi:hypothetical protein
MNNIFNKSFNDLKFLENNIDSNYKIIFVFDFDLTLTLKLTDNIYSNYNFIELFDSYDKLEKLKNILNKIKNKGNLIYINTRGKINDIEYILNKLDIGVGNDKLIKCIKGSITKHNITNPLTEKEIELYNLKNIDDINILWGVKKVIYLNEICNIENVPINNILFFDDYYVNINIAKLNGYINSYLVGTNDDSIIGLDYLLIKLSQILDTLDII